MRNELLYNGLRLRNFGNLGC